MSTGCRRGQAALDMEGGSLRSTPGTSRDVTVSSVLIGEVVSDGGLEGQAGLMLR